MILSHELFYVPWKAHMITEFQLFDGFLRLHFSHSPTWHPICAGCLCKEGSAAA